MVSWKKEKIFYIAYRNRAGKLIERLMTHKSPMMTQRYAHLRDETLKRGANVMSRIVAAAFSEAEIK